MATTPPAKSEPREGFLSRKKILGDLGKYEEYKQAKIEIERKKALSKLQELKAEAAYNRSQNVKAPKYQTAPNYMGARVDKTDTRSSPVMGAWIGKVFSRAGSKEAAKGFNSFTRGIKTFGTPEGTRALYERQGQLPPSFMQKRAMTIAGSRTGKKGRPAGTLDKRYAAFGGVYGWRKYQATQLKIARMNAMQQATVSPEQQAYLNQMRARQQASQMNPERRTIPTTFGTIPLKGIMDEIDAASNIFD